MSGEKWATRVLRRLGPYLERASRAAEASGQLQSRAAVPSRFEELELPTGVSGQKLSSAKSSTALVPSTARHTHTSSTRPLRRRQRLGLTYSVCRRPRRGPRISRRGRCRRRRRFGDAFLCPLACFRDVGGSSRSPKIDFGSF